MPSIDEFLDTIRETEFQESELLQRVAPRSSITKTANRRSLGHITPKEPTVFKPRIILLAALMPGTVFTIGLFLALKGLLTGIGSRAGELLLVPLSLLVIYAILKQIVFNKRLNYTITLTPQGISLDKDFFNWTDIQETAILHLPIGKGGTDYLVLLFKDNQYAKWDLSNFTSFPYSFGEKLSTYIEYFKALKANN